MIPLVFLTGCGPVLIVTTVLLLDSSGNEDCNVSGQPVQVTFQGTISYEDRPEDPLIQGTTLSPVRRARVEVLQVNCGETVIATGETGVDGQYLITCTTPSGSELRISVLAESSDPDVPVSVRTGAGEKLLYSYESAKYPLTEDTVQGYSLNLDVPLDCEHQTSGAFNLLDSIRIGFSTISGAFSPPHRALTVLWALGSPDGTYFSTTAADLDGDGQGDDPFIQVRGGTTAKGCHDTDQFDGSLVLHEFGHYVAYYHSQDDSPGGPHGIAEQVDPRLAWSEGWSDFFCTMARNDPKIYDTFEDIRECSWPCTYFSYDLSTNDGSCASTACCQGIGSEDAVGSFLWDLYDPESPPSDQVQASREDILLALAALKGSGARFVYVGDYIPRVESILPSKAAGIQALADAQGLLEGDGSPTPFPQAFDSLVQTGNAVQASASGNVNGCDSLACKMFVENFIGSSEFYELQVPGSAGQGGTVTADLSISSLDASCSSALELRIFNESQTFYYSSAGQQGSSRQIQFSFDSQFQRGSYLLFEVAGDIPIRAGSSHGEKGDFILEVNVR